jgi:hypothetical protein
VLFAREDLWRRIAFAAWMRKLRHVRYINEPLILISADFSKIALLLKLNNCCKQIQRGSAFDNFIFLHRLLMRVLIVIQKFSLSNFIFIQYYMLIVRSPITSSTMHIICRQLVWAGIKSAPIMNLNMGPKISCNFSALSYFFSNTRTWEFSAKVFTKRC